ncbi:hypothetical protein [Saccharobesus litoralis]|nr:hypothetical protein [Saccharobesus litoralis]
MKVSDIKPVYIATGLILSLGIGIGILVHLSANNSVLVANQQVMHSAEKDVLAANNSSSCEQQNKTTPLPMSRHAAVQTYVSANQDDDADPENSSNIYQQPTLTDTLHLGLTQQQADTFLEAPAAENYQELANNLSLIPDVLDAISTLEEDSIARQYYLTLLKNIPEIELAKVVEQLLLQPRIIDQQSAISLLPAMTDSKLRARVIQTALQQNLDSHGLNLVSSFIADDPHLSTSAQIQKLLNRTYNASSDPLARLSILKASSFNVAHQTAAYHDVMQHINSTDMTTTAQITLQAIDVVKTWLTNKPFTLTPQQRDELKNRIREIANDPINPLPVRLNSINVLQLLG